LAPVRVSVLVPSLLRLPVPEMALATVSALERLKASVPLLATLPAPRLPVAPPLPICSVPDEIVVPPL
jgi:hypothetical protein